MPIKPRKLIILRSLPEAGKSTTAKLLSDANPFDDTEIHSTDDFYMRYVECHLPDDKFRYEWKYVFDGSKLREYHFRNLCAAIESMTHGINLVIVDNTNTTFDEMKKYCIAAIILGYEIQLIEPETEWRYDVEECYKRNTHGVPLETIQKMRNRWETTEACYAKIEFLKNAIGEIK